MFTPPPSPLPPTTTIAPSERFTSVDGDDNSVLTIPSYNDTLTTSHNEENDNHLDATPLREKADSTLYHLTQVSAQEKQKMTRRIRWSVLVVPVVLILVALSTRSVAHPAAFDFFSPTLASEQTFGVDFIGTHAPHATLLHHEKRSPDGSDSSSSSNSTPSPTVLGSPSATSSASAAASTSSLPDPTLQSVPDAPTVTVAVPTPFPQPFDTTLSNNFSTQGCSAFFTNMTQSDAFRQCRPFSLLYQSSNAFSTAQSNLTLLNSIIYGTCNTPLSEQTCISNMQWFASELQTVCDIDLKNDIALAQNGLTGLQAYVSMRASACLVNQVSGAYCFVESVHSANPSDFFYYGIPLGTPVPNTTGSQPSCDACTQSVMRLYVQAITSVPALEETYPSAAQMANKQCGAGYVALDDNGSSSGAAALLPWRVDGMEMWSWWTILVLGIVRALMV